MKKMFMLFTIAIFVIVIHLRFGSNIHDIYKENWNISIPNPTKYISPIEHVGAGDILVFDIMHYEDEDIRYLISKKEFNRIDFELEAFIIMRLEKISFII